MKYESIDLLDREGYEMISDEKLSAECKWHSINQIPETQFQNFGELIRLVNAGDVIIGINYSAARARGHLYRGLVGNLIAYALALVPYMVPIALAIATFMLHKPILLLGIPISLITFIIANPLEPYKVIVSTAAFICTIVFLISAFQWGNIIFIVLLASFIVPFWAIRAFYRNSTYVLRRAVMHSEVLFLYL